MTTLAEFKETCRRIALLFPCGIDRVSDEQYLDAHRKDVGAALHALPALIAVAEGMAIDMGRIANHFDQDVYENGWKSLALEMADVARQALAAYEAWKGKIEEE